MSAPSTVPALNQSINPSNAEGSNLAYPADLASFTYFMSLHFVQYNRLAQDAEGKFTPVGNIYLPMPMNLSEEFAMAYNSGNLGLFGNKLTEAFKAGQSAADAVLARKGEFGDALAGVNMGRFSSEAVTGLGAAGAILAPALFEDSGPAGRAAQQALGLVQNPHLTTIFEGVELRKHSLSWIFSPRSKAESHTLESIINAIRSWAHPTYTPNLQRFALDFPKQVFCNFIGTNYLYPIKRAVITTIAVDNSSDGVSFYGGGAPVQIKFTINLQETEILTSADFKQGTTSFTTDGSFAGPDAATTPQPATPPPAGDGAGAGAP